jgi:hypothetical protein
MEMGFAPLDPVNVPVGWMIVKLYPKIIPLMPMHERAHAFQVNKLALKDLPTNHWLVIVVCRLKRYCTYVLLARLAKVRR